MPFQLEALPAETFAHLHMLTDAELLQHRAVRRVADGDKAPCRVSLRFAQRGETLVLVNYQHLKTESPYAAS